MGNIDIMWNNDKGWGARVDTSPATHPIYVEVETTDKASTIFDGISYSKGAAVLR